MLYRVLQSNDRHGITDTIVDVCAMLRGLTPMFPACRVELPRTEIEMMILTVAAESSFKYRKQIGGGPARGLMGMEPPTARDTFRWLRRKHLEGRPDWARLTDIWLGLRSVPAFTPTAAEFSAHLAGNDAFALALGRLHYRMIPAPFPVTMPFQAQYWKQYWNTEEGAGKFQDALNRWEECGCDELMVRAERRAKLV